MTSTSTRIFAAACTLLICSATNAAVIGDELASYTRTTSFGNATLSHIASAYLVNGGISGPRVFDSMQWTTADIGTTRTLNATGDPHYSAFVARLVNGIGGDGDSTSDPENIIFFTGIFNVGAGGRRENEAFYLFGDSGDPRIDLAGKTINYMSMRLNSLTFTSPGRDLNGNGVWTDTTASFTWTIHGIPEPTCLAPLAAASLVRRRR